MWVALPVASRVRVLGMVHVGLEIWDLGFKYCDLGSNIEELMSRVSCSGFRVYKCEAFV